jgi:hypothetical protein
MFIKVMVDFSHMSQTLLPYALNLNPGIPTHIQQAMVEQEAERRALQASESMTVPAGETDNDEIDR